MASINTVPELTPKQELFCLEYIKDLNGSAAAVRAGYSESSAREIASENLTKPAIHDLISRLFASRAERVQIDADWVLRQSVKLHQRCMNEIEVYRDRKGEPILDENGELQYVFNATGAAKALELVGKHIGVQAFREQVGLSGAIGVATIPVEALTDEQLRVLATIPSVGATRAIEAAKDETD